MAEELKKHGNECFAKGKLDAAIEAYSEAICLDPKCVVYRTNRAMCCASNASAHCIKRPLFSHQSDESPSIPSEPCSLPSLQ